MKIFSGGSKNFLAPEGGLRKFVHFKTNRKGGGGVPPKKIEPLARGGC